MQYTVLTDCDQDGLSAQVDEHLGQGWELVGGVSVTGWREEWENERKGYSESETITIYAQAVLFKGNL